MSKSSKNSANKIKHLEFVYNLITRIAYTSLAIKAIASCVMAVLALRFGGYACLVPLIAFWPLDSFYLLQERRYQIVHTAVRSGWPEATNFSMNLLMPQKGWPKNCRFFSCLMSWTEAVFYFWLSFACCFAAFLAELNP